MSTEIGAIQRQIAEAAGEEEDTPLKKKLDAFGEGLAAIILWVCVLVWLINYKHFVSLSPSGKARLGGLFGRISLGQGRRLAARGLDLRAPSRRRCLRPCSASLQRSAPASTRAASASSSPRASTTSRSRWRWPWLRSRRGCPR